MSDDAVLAAFTKTMVQLKDALTGAEAAQATAKLAWDASKTEKTRMAATDAINKQWETDAKAAFKVVDDKYTGDLKQLKVYEVSNFYFINFYLTNYINMLYSGT
jgi:hypothetical protein